MKTLKRNGIHGYSYTSFPLSLLRSSLMTNAFESQTLINIGKTENDMKTKLLRNTISPIHALSMSRIVLNVFLFQSCTQPQRSRCHASPSLGIEVRVPVDRKREE